MNKPKVIAFYLPQYHPMPENDKWWGKGFTEWTSVAKAKPLYRGHVQPKIPADLGFYDLRLSASREDQAKLAKENGIYGFCYWHYWFNGKRLMNQPFDEVVKSGKPDFPFCLAWANHSWYQKGWSNGNSMVMGKSKLLIEQTYGGVEDFTNHFYSMLDAFKDRRYIKIHGKLLFMVYNALGFDDFPLFKKTWEDLAKKEGLPGFYFITHACIKEQIDKIDTFIDNGFEAVNVSLHRMPFKSERRSKENRIQQIIQKIKNRINVRIKPEIVSYSEAIKWMDSDIFDRKDIIPTIIPNWDHTPRSGRFGRVFQNCTADLFGKHVSMIFRRNAKKEDDDNIIFLKSWNEWGEGNYIEPDLESGDSFLKALKSEIEKV